MSLFQKPAKPEIFVFYANVPCNYQRDRKSKVNKYMILIGLCPLILKTLVLGTYEYELKESLIYYCPEDAIMFL